MTILYCSIIVFILMEICIKILMKEGSYGKFLKFTQKILFILIIIAFILIFIIKFFNINSNIIVNLYIFLLIILDVIIATKLHKIDKDK